MVRSIKIEYEKMVENETTCQKMSNKVKACQNMVALVTMASLCIKEAPLC